MPGDSVTFRLEGELTISKVSDAFARFSRVLDELQRDQEANVTWVLAGLDFGSAVATARAIPNDEESAALVPGLYQAFLDAARTVGAGGVDPTRRLLTVVRDLTDLADENHHVVLETADDDVVFIAPVIPFPSARATSTTSKSLGTVRGRVETLSHRKGLRFTLYDLASDRAISCYLQADHEAIMRDAWGRVADVTGQVTRDATTGRAISIRKVTAVDVVNEGDQMGFLRARGAVGGTESAEVIIRRIRDAS